MHTYTVWVSGRVDKRAERISRCVPTHCAALIELSVKVGAEPTGTRQQDRHRRASAGPSRLTSWAAHVRSARRRPDSWGTRPGASEAPHRVSAPQLRSTAPAGRSNQSAHRTRCARWVKPNPPTAFPISTPTVAIASTTAIAGASRLRIRRNARNSRRAATGNRRRSGCPAGCAPDPRLSGAPPEHQPETAVTTSSSPSTSRSTAAATAAIMAARRMR